MVKWTVRAIQVGSIELDRSAMTHFKGKGERITVPIWCAGATDGTHKVIVDTGIRDLQEYRKAEPGVRQTPDQVTTTAIKRIMDGILKTLILLSTHIFIVTIVAVTENLRMPGFTFRRKNGRLHLLLLYRKHLFTINSAMTKMQLIIFSGTSLREMRKSYQG